MHMRLVDAQASLANLADAPTNCFETPQKQWEASIRVKTGSRVDILHVPSTNIKA